MKSLELLRVRMQEMYVMFSAFEKIVRVSQTSRCMLCISLDGFLVIEISASI